MKKKRTPEEQRRREAANERKREKVRRLRKRGLCRCGLRLDKKPGTGRLYSTCPACREKGRASALRYYYEGPQECRPKEPKFDLRLRDQTGIRRRLERDGMGREAWWWVCSGTVDGRQRARRFSIDKYGDLGAFRLARDQRREWEKGMLS